MNNKDTILVTLWDKEVQLSKILLTSASISIYSKQPLDITDKLESCLVGYLKSLHEHRYRFSLYCDEMMYSTNGHMYREIKKIVKQFLLYFSQRYRSMGTYTRSTMVDMIIRPDKPLSSHEIIMSYIRLNIFISLILDLSLDPRIIFERCGTLISFLFSIEKKLKYIKDVVIQNIDSSENTICILQTILTNVNVFIYYTIVKIKKLDDSSLLKFLYNRRIKNNIERNTLFFQLRLGSTTK